MSSRALLALALVVAIAIVAAYFLMYRGAGDSYQRTDYPTQIPTQTAPVPVGDTAPPPPNPESEPVNPDDTGGAAHGGSAPPPQ